jgi:hypothetical protein
MTAKLLALCVVLAAIGCTEKQSPEERAAIAKIVLHGRPHPTQPLDIQFENKLKLLGYDISARPVTVGQPFTVTWYWQVIEPLDAGWKIFTHLNDGKTNRINLDATRIMRSAYPEDRWKQGQFLRDEQEITLPDNWGSDTAVFYLGFYSGETRLHVVKGPDDGSSRAEALRVAVVRKPPIGKPIAPAVARLIARKVTGPIKLDGKLDEPDWGEAQSTGSMVNTMSGAAGAFEARAQVLYDANNIYCAFVVVDDYLKATFKNNDDHLWEQDTVEVMFDPDGDAKNYFELQVSPRGVHFDTRYDSPRNPRPFGHVDWDSKVEAKVSLDGDSTLDDDKPDHGYTVEFAVPWSAFATGEPPATRPSAGTTWRMNFFVMDARPNGQRAVGWSPPRIGDFHTLDKFGRVVFPEDPK